MSKRLPSIKLTLKKTLAALLVPLIGWTVATLYNRDTEMIGWSILIFFLVFMMYVGLHSKDWIKEVLELIKDFQTGKAKRMDELEGDREMRKEELETIKAMRPSNAALSKAIAEDLLRENIDGGSPTNTAIVVDSIQEREDKISKLEQQLVSAKSVIDTQNELIKELEMNGIT